ncbi:MAG TPA: response regulator [Clostridia bacterium]|nr:response regulator [Clostridia bacterium]
MYRLLIVDDEIPAVEGIKAGVEWGKFEISEVWTAYNSRQAKEIFEAHSIDLMICDIEMPQGNGLELLAWVKEYYEVTKCIFLTCHADFKYAKEAIRLGSFEYLLKPVIFSELEEAIAKALCVTRKEREASLINERSSYYYNLWILHQPLLIERFWVDLLQGHIPAEPEPIRQYIAKADIAYTSDMRFIPVLIKVQRWHNKMLLHDERIKEHELRNSAIKLLIKEDKLSQVIQVKRGLFLVIHVLSNGRPLDNNQIKEGYRTFIDKCITEFGCDISCYIGMEAAINRIPEAYEALLGYDKSFVMLNKIIHVDEHVTLQKPSGTISFAGWQELFQQGKKEKWKGEVDKTFASLSGLSSFNVNYLHEFFHDFMQMIYAVLKQKDLPAHLMLSHGERLNEDELALTSIDSLEEMVLRIGNTVFDSIQEADKSCSIIDKIKLYISQNMGYDLTRDSIAKQFYLNPDYLTRIFKKETGLSISDYLIRERVNIAKQLLVNTDMPVKDIVSRVGYTNFSYFSQIFRENTGLNPLTYRKTNAN